MGDFSWDGNSLPSLVDVNLEIPAGQLVVVVGTTGSGKSTLLSAMLGQMQQVGKGPGACWGHVWADAAGGFGGDWWHAGADAAGGFLKHADRGM